MPYYYLYHCDNDGHVVSRTNIYAETDEHAVRKARECQVDQDIEVWCLERQICALKRPD